MTNADHPAGKIEIITTEPVKYLMINGHGDPEAFLEFGARLRAVAEELGHELRPLEALWWTEDGGEMSPDNMDAWRWTVMIALPDDADTTRPLPGNIRYETLDEGEAVQRLYVGSLRDKDPELKEMLAHAREQGYEPTGKYHEIYLDDPGPGSPPDAHTLLRQPINRAMAK